MKVTRFVMALILGLSIMSATIVKADDDRTPQEGTDIRKRCPQGYVRVGDRCLRASNNLADPNQPETLSSENSPTTNDIEDIIFMEIVRGVFYFIVSSVR